jgi:hypothetical protein
VRILSRVKFGPLDLAKMDLKPGDSRLLTPREVTALKRAAEKAGLATDGHRSAPMKKDWKKAASKPKFS